VYVGEDGTDEPEAGKEDDSSLGIHAWDALANSDLAVASIKPGVMKGVPTPGFPVGLA
jgi:hypothetical protein